MERETRSITTEGITGPYFLLIVLSVAGMAVSLYLTNNYMQAKFPQGLATASACNINSFFNCNSSSFSPISNIAGLPISVLGLLFFVNLLISCIFPHAPWERANHSLAWINVLGCFVLFLYTLFFLDTMCPFCMGHWIISLAIALLLWKRGLPMALPTGRVLGIYLGLSTVVVGGYTWSIQGKKQSSNRLAYALIQQYNRRPLVQGPDSPHKIHLSTQNFKDAPLRISKFSDFQCPACREFAEIIPQLIKRYQGKINIQYLFYPLDQNCNDGIKRAFHPLACQAAFLAHCSEDKFVTVHDEIFAHQDGLTQTWIDKRARELGIQDCQNSPDTLNFVKGHIALGNQLEVTSTPTLIVNGKRIPGSLQLNQFYLLFDQILEQQ